MKKKRNMLFLTLAIAGIGAGALFLSSNWVMASVQDRLGMSGEIVASQEDSKEQPIETITIPEYMEKDYYEGLKSLAKATLVYYGQNVYVKDDMEKKEVATTRGNQIMDFIFGDYMEEKFFKPCGIDKTEYTYSIQRQPDEENIRYGVFLMKEGRILCTIGVLLGDEISLRAFARDGLIDLRGAEDNPIPEEYLTQNWCDTREKKEAIYDAYFESSKEVIENVLGLASIDTSFNDVTKTSCFAADDDWSTVTLGYQLEDDTYITVSYNRVNQMWDGFCQH